MLAMLQCFSLNKRLRNIITTKPTTDDSLYCKLLPSERSNTCGERDCEGDKADYCRDYCRNQAPFVYHLKYTILAFHLACCLIAERTLIKKYFTQFTDHGGSTTLSLELNLLDAAWHTNLSDKGSVEFQNLTNEFINQVTSHRQ